MTQSPELTKSHFVTDSDATIGLILRLDAIGVVIHTIDGKIQFPKATTIPKEQFYATGRFVGNFHNLVLISVRPSVQRMEDDIEVRTYTAKSGGTGLAKLFCDDIPVEQDDFNHPGEYHLILEAAIDAGNFRRLQSISEAPESDSIAVIYPEAA